MAKSLFAGLIALASTSAFAAAGELSTSVEPLSPVVTYSRAATTSPARPALDTFVGYRVSIGNVDSNTINNIAFTATATVTDTDERAVFSSADGATCTTTNAAGTAIHCTIGQLKAGEAYPTFFVFFKAPIKDTLSPLPDGNVDDCVNTDCVSLSGQTLYAEQARDANSVPRNSIDDWVPVAVALGTNNPTFVKSGLQKSGGTIFTGDGAIPSTADPFTSSVTAPVSPVSTTVTLSEFDASANVNCRALGNFNTCFGVEVSLPDVVFAPGSGNFLTFVLRVDDTNIKPGTKIGSVLIQYDDGHGNLSNVGQCANATTPRTDGVPCIASAIDYKNKRAPGWTPDLDSTFQFTLINLGNGLFNLY